MRVVLAGFGPFPGAPFNPSAALVEALAHRRRPALAGIERITHIFATTYAAVDREIPRLVATKPDIVLIFGLAGRRRALCIETRARNAVSILFPDASGYRPKSSIIAEGGPGARRGNAPFAQLLAAVRPLGVPARLSRDAGRYLCNYAYWRALEQSRDGGPLVQFIHIPPVGLKPRRRRSKRRSISLPPLVAATEALLLALLAASRR
ncbi:MAG: pyroglutamyl-peptidase I [Xanthobacteraceae bacterium]